MHPRCVLWAALFNMSAFGAEFVTMTKIQILVARGETASLPPCDPSPTNGLPPFCLASDLPSFDPNAGASSTALSTAPAPSCSLNKADPDQGVNKAYCLCDSTLTLPVLSIDPATSPGPDASCAYTAIPSTSATSSFDPVTTLGPAVTNSKLCQVCTPVVNNEDTCTTISNCLPQAAQAQVQAGSSSVHVGTLTGAALYTSVSSAIEKLCPPVTQTINMTVCSTDTVNIGGIPYPEDENGFLDYGELGVSIEGSQYNETSLRDAMIQSAALAIQNSATGNNCYDMAYDLPATQRRSGPVDWIRRALGFEINKRDGGQPRKGSLNVCNAIGFAGVNYYNPFWRLAPQPGATDYIAVHWDFHVVGGEFICEIIQDLIDGLAAIEPEFAVEDVDLGEEIQAICTSALSH